MLKIVNLDNLLARAGLSTPTIATTRPMPQWRRRGCAQAASDTTTRHLAWPAAMRDATAAPGHIWGNNTAAWKQGEHRRQIQRAATRVACTRAYPQRIRCRNCQRLQPASWKRPIPLKVVRSPCSGGLIKAGNLAACCCPWSIRLRSTKVTGPLRNMSYDQWKTWVDNIGKYGAYGKEFTEG